MKAIILAAGIGSRLKKYTKDLPKGMLEVLNKSLIEHQIEIYRSLGINDISIITGFKSETIKFNGIRYFHNKNYKTTNMIETLMVAREIFDEDIIISYSDILFTKELMQSLISNKNEIVITADSHWKKYWNFRYDTTEFDLEEFSIENKRVLALGQELNNSSNLEYRYVGTLKFKKGSLARILEIYDNKKKDNSYWGNSGKPFIYGYMTDFIQEIIDRGVPVFPDIVNRGWLEFDTVDDYERVVSYLKTNTLQRLFLND